MILALILTAIFNVAVICLLAGSAWYLHKFEKEQAVTNRYLKDLWVYYENAAGEQLNTNKKLDDLVALFKATFNKKYEDKLDDLIHIKEKLPETVKVLCDDGKFHDLPVDAGY